MWFPIARSWLDFAGASVEIEPAERRFTAELQVPGPTVNGAELRPAGRRVPDRGRPGAQRHRAGPGAGRPADPGRWSAAQPGELLFNPAGLRLAQQHDQFLLGPHAELGEHRGQVVAHGALGQVELPGDGRHPVAGQQPVDDLQLPAGQLGQRPAAVPVASSRAPPAAARPWPNRRSSSSADPRPSDRRRPARRRLRERRSSGAGCDRRQHQLAARAGLVGRPQPDRQADRLPGCRRAGRARTAGRPGRPG